MKNFIENRFFTKKDLKIVIYGVIIGILIHGFILTNDIPNWDDLSQLYGDFVYMRRLGRWFIFFPTRISSLLGLTWMNGILVILYISVSSMLIIKVLDIQSDVSKYLLLTLMLSFPSIGSVLFYTQYADGYAFALLLMSLAVFAFSQLSYPWLFFGIVLSVLSLGTYQSFFVFGCAIIVIWMIKRVLDVGDTKFIIISAVKIFLSLVLSLLCYLGITKLATKDVLADYQNVNHMGETDIITLIRQTRVAYSDFYKFFVQDNRFFHGRYTIIVICSFLLGVAFFLLYAYKQRIWENIINVVLLVLLICIFPLSCNLIHLMGADHIHAQMIYGFVAAYIWVICMGDRYFLLLGGGNETKAGIIVRVIALGCASCLALITYKYILSDNMVYSSAKISYEQTYGYAERLVARIEACEGFSSDDRVLLVGSITYDPAAVDTAWMSEDVFRGYTGIPTRLVTSYRMTMFMNKYLGFPAQIDWAEQKDLNELNIENLVSELPCYPDDGSISKIDEGVIVVKLSDIQED